MGSVYFIFYVCLKLRFPDVDTNPGRGDLILLYA